MTDTLRHLLRDEVEPLDVPPPPVDAILSGGRRRRTVRRVQGVAVAAVCLTVVAGGLVGANRILADDGPGPTTPPATGGPTTSTPDVQGSLVVSGAGVAGERFGAGAGEVEATVTERLGEPDVVVGPQQYFRIPGNDGWFEVADDTLSPRWAYPVASVTCWGRLCLLFGGDDADSLSLRGWELSDHPRWGAGRRGGASSAEVRLADTGIGLGDSWDTLHAAYPDAVAGGGEGASLVVQETPWPGVFDGVGEWRLSGVWDYQHPNRVPDGAVVTRLSAGEGPEPGCC